MGDRHPPISILRDSRGRPMEWMYPLTCSECPQPGWPNRNRKHPFPQSLLDFIGGTPDGGRRFGCGSGHTITVDWGVRSCVSSEES